MASLESTAAKPGSFFKACRALDSLVAMAAVAGEMGPCFLAAAGVEHEDVEGRHSGVLEEHAVSFVDAVSADELLPAGLEDYFVGVTAYSDAPCLATWGLQTDDLRDVAVEVICKSCRYALQQNHVFICFVTHFFLSLPTNHA